MQLINQLKVQVRFCPVYKNFSAQMVFSALMIMLYFQKLTRATTSRWCSQHSLPISGSGFSPFLSRGLPKKKNPTSFYANPLMQLYQTKQSSGSQIFKKQKSWGKYKYAVESDSKLIHRLLAVMLPAEDGHFIQTMTDIYQFYCALQPPLEVSNVPSNTPSPPPTRTPLEPETSLHASSASSVDVDLALCPPLGLGLPSSCTAAYVADLSYASPLHLGH